jgi:glycogen debranching enzyme
MPLEVRGASLDDLLSREWLAVNHLGGYATSTVAGLNTRKYHGLLVASLAPPVRRMVLLSRVEETVIVGSKPDPLANSEYPGTIHPRGFQALAAFSNDPFPRWAYQGDGWTLQKELHLLRGHSTVCLRYTLLAGAQTVCLEIRPLLALRAIHELTFQSNARLAAEPVSSTCLRVGHTARTPQVFLAHDGSFENLSAWYLNTIYRREVQRGYAGLEDLWMPGIFSWDLSPGQTVHLVCSLEQPDLAKVIAEVDEASRSEDSRRGLRITHDSAVRAQPRPSPHLAALLRAADQFIVEIPAPDPVEPSSTTPLTPVASFTAAEPTIVIISAYPWGAPNLRDALIALPGLLLATSRLEEAGAYLSSLIVLERDGLLPTELSEDGSGLRYEGADVSLWFIHAVHQYLQALSANADDAASAESSNPRAPTHHPHLAGRDGLLRTVRRIISNYRAGTAAGIGLEPDGLLRSRLPNVPTTWMDAKVGDWVITPRAGMPVELNALWHNALCAAVQMLRDTRLGGTIAADPQHADELSAAAAAMRRAFNQRFWNDTAACCFDVVSESGAPDPSVRANQLLAASLPFPVLAAEYGARMLQTVGKHLLTPMGLRTLAPFDPNYLGTYGGDVVNRDRAYHQGSVYPWLFGPWADAMVQVHGASPQVRQEIAQALHPCIDYLQNGGCGQLCELFDGDEPHTPGGAVASARSVGEVLRAYFAHLLPPAAKPRDNDGSGDTRGDSGGNKDSTGTPDTPERRVHS